MVCSQRFDADRTFVDSFVEISKAVDGNLTGILVGELADGRNFTVDLHGTDIFQFSGKFNTGCTRIVGKGAAVGKLDRTKGHIAGGVGEAAGVAHCTENRTCGSDTDQNTCIFKVFQSTLEFRNLGHSHCSGVGDLCFFIKSDAAVNNELVAVGDNTVDLNRLIIGGDVELALRADIDISSDGGTARFTDQVEDTDRTVDTDIDLSGNVVLSRDDQFTAVADTDTGLDIHIHIRFDGNKTAVNNQTVTVNIGIEDHAVSITGDPGGCMDTPVHEGNDHGSGIGDTQIVSIGDRTEAVGVIDFHVVGVIHITKGVFCRIDRQEAGVGERTLEGVFGRIDGERRPSSLLYSARICPGITGIDSTIQGFAFDMQFSSTVDADISTAGTGAGDILRIQRMSRGTTFKAAGKSHQIFEIIISGIVSTPEGTDRMTVVGEVAADSDFGTSFDGEGNMTPDTDIAHIFNDGNIGISADVDVRGVQRCCKMDLALRILGERLAEFLNGGFILSIVSDRNADPVVKAARHGDVTAGNVEVGFDRIAAAGTVNGTDIDIVLEEDITAGDRKCSVTDSKSLVERNIAVCDIELTAGNDLFREGHFADRINIDDTRIFCSGLGTGRVGSVVILVVIRIAGKILVATETGIPNVAVADRSIGHLIGKSDVAAGHIQSTAVDRKYDSGNGIVVTCDRHYTVICHSNIVGNGAGGGFRTGSENQVELSAFSDLDAFALEAGRSDSQVQSSLFTGQRIAADKNIVVKHSTVTQRDIGSSACDTETAQISGIALELSTVTGIQIQDTALNQNHTFSSEVISQRDIGGTAATVDRKISTEDLGSGERIDKCPFSGGDGHIISADDVESSQTAVADTRQNGVILNIEGNDIISGFTVDLDVIAVDISVCSNLGGGSSTAELEVAVSCEFCIFIEFQLAGNIHGISGQNNCCTVNGQSLVTCNSSVKSADFEQ